MKKAMYISFLSNSTISWSWSQQKLVTLWTKWQENYIFPRSIFKTLSNIQDRVFCENSWRIIAVNYFRETLHLRFLTGFWTWLCFPYLKRDGNTSANPLSFICLKSNIWTIMSTTYHTQITRNNIITDIVKYFRKTVNINLTKKRILTHFVQLAPFYTPWKHKTFARLWKQTSGINGLKMLSIVAKNYTNLHIIYVDLTGFF